MFHEEKLQNPLPANVPIAEPEKPQKPDFGVASMSLEEMLDVRGQIDARLPQGLLDIDLHRELVIQLRQAQLLLSKVMGLEDTPANQKAQVVNTCSNALEQLMKLQNSVYTSERLKRIEQSLIKAVRKHFSAEAKAEFFEGYEQIYNEGGKS